MWHSQRINTHVQVGNIISHILNWYNSQVKPIYSFGDHLSINCVSLTYFKGHVFVFSFFPRVYL